MSIELATEQPFGRGTRQMSKMMDQWQKGFFTFCPSETWTPNVNLYETEGAYVVCVDLAGVDKEKIDLSVVDQQLTLKGTRAVPAPEGENANEAGHRVRVHLMEIDHGAFCREVELPHDVVTERINATYRNGVLWIEMPKTRTGFAEE